MEMRSVFGLVLLTSIIAFTSAGKATFDGENFIVEWMVLPSSKEIEFNVTAKTIGWVGLGITEIRLEMKKLDVVVGGVNGGRPYLLDMHADGEAPPTKDQKQDVTLLSGSQNIGTTMIRFKRKLDTGDAANDNAIKVNQPYWLAWAYHNKDDVSIDLSTFQKHTSRDYSGSKITLVPASDSPTTTTITITSTATTSATTMKSTAIVSGVNTAKTTPKSTTKSTSTVATPTTTASAFSPSILFLAVTAAVIQVLNK